ncbi:MAG: hypothetical protein ACXVBW_02400 [Bdellovibrionota bacterium]
MIAAQGCTPFQRIRPGMTKTDVLVELGTPSDALQIRGKDYFVYPSSQTATCRIEFVDERVTERKMVCDDTEQYRGLASVTRKDFEQRNTEPEQHERIERYCGLRPPAKPGCRLTNRCINGAWEERCD